MERITKCAQIIRCILLHNLRNCNCSFHFVEDNNGVSNNLHSYLHYYRFRIKTTISSNLDLMPVKKITYFSTAHLLENSTLI